MPDELKKSLYFGDLSLYFQLHRMPGKSLRKAIYVTYFRARNNGVQYFFPGKEKTGRFSFFITGSDQKIH